LLGFDAPRLVDENGHQYFIPEVTRVMDATYPTPIRDWTRQHGGLTQRPIFLHGRELATLYPLCH
jgi:hypothetical protein